MSRLLGWLGEQDEFVFLDCAKLSGEEHRSFLFTGPNKWLVCRESGQAAAFLAEADALRSQGYYLAGWLGYEFGYLMEPSLAPLCPQADTPYVVFGVFDNPLIIDHQTGDWKALDKLLQASEETEEKPVTIDNLRTNIDKAEYLQAIDRIKDYIVAGDTYQVNFTMKLLFGFNGSPSALYGSMRRNQAVSYGAWIRHNGRDIMSFSPELFFRADKDRITVRPMKGTMKRGRNLAEDKLQRKALRSDIKNRSENVMIVDLLRNDLGRLLHSTGGGKVQPRSLFDVEVYDTLLQMTSTIDGIPSGGSLPGLKDILPPLFPCGSVTGAPKIRTMEIINELEKEPRGVYCGAVGFSGPRESVFNVPIRTVVLEGNRGEMGIGSGIVFDSEPEAEWQESLLKGKFLTRSQPDFQLIETLLWLPGSGYWLLDEHIERLSDSAEYFLFVPAKERVVGWLEEKAQSFSGPTRVRLLLHRDGSVHITDTELDRNVQPLTEILIAAGPLPKVVFSAVPTDPDNLHLYHKTTQRTLYVDERERAVDRGYYEVLFTNTNGEVTEGSISNIFVVRDGRLLTPPISSGLLAGTFRRFLIDRGMASEKVLTRKDILQSEAVYVGNSVRGLVQVDVTGG
jgi:para-aminobenzoate synthetase/4-amino-4-deoxychorismate lyase